MYAKKNLLEKVIVYNVTHVLDAATSYYRQPQSGVRFQFSRVGRGGVIHHRSTVIPVFRRDGTSVDERALPSITAHRSIIHRTPVTALDTPNICKHVRQRNVPRTRRSSQIPSIHHSHPNQRYLWYLLRLN
jgi:hypothetical protein